ncbi:MAG: hypothetical protein IPH07_07280 [Deltaproteobacteria bacterium]|nr:hypothetical protein [Deltaproteobacteria bacterium]MBK8717837.1 hypothetical protein [Deltaproteobacteria bacterium]MBP7287801.1 hypothetical protein [Nannocystaceae bacterium]
MKNGSHNPGAWSLPAWSRIGAFQVFGDYAAMPGFRVVVALGPSSQALTELLEARATASAWLDPELARANLRAGLGLMRGGVGDFVYANAEQTMVLVRRELSARAGAAVALQSQLVSQYAARLSLLCGRELSVQARIFEFPDLTVVRRAMATVVEETEETTPLRSSIWLGAQLRGRGQPFHPSMVETIEEQTSLLRGHGIDMDSLPAWWWRGVAAQRVEGGAPRLFDDLPHGEAFGELVPE